MVGTAAIHDQVGAIDQACHWAGYKTDNLCNFLWRAKAASWISFQHFFKKLGFVNAHFVPYIALGDDISGGTQCSLVRHRSPEFSTSSSYNESWQL